MEKLVKQLRNRLALHGRLVVMAALAMGAGACKDFFEEPITDSRVELLSPGADAQTSVYAVTFLWEPLDGALQYRLQLASPSFEDAVLFHADTTLEQNRFSISLEPGRYQWRVKARNGSSETPYTTRTLTIHEAALSTQTVLQAAPPDNFLTSQSRVTLEWQGIFSASSYRVQVDTNGFADESQLVLEQVVEGESFAYTMPAEAEYEWRVRAENDTAQSRWSTVRRFIHDRTPPDAPALAAPANNAQVRSPATLQWHASEDAVSYRLYVYKSDSTLYSSQFPLRQTGTSYTFDAGTRGERVLWRVRATDRAGNESGYSGWRNFTIIN